MRYTLMNKDTPLMDFHWELVLNMEHEAVVDKVYRQPWFIQDLESWLRDRSVTKHREHMKTLLTTLGLTDTKSIIDFSKGLSLTDTLWVNVEDRYAWADVNLFDNEFDEVIERTAFDGGMYGMQFSRTSPEFGTNGSYAKCWHREADGIYLYKQGSFGFANSGYEVYSELYASDLLDQLGYPHPKYDLIRYRGKLVSRCKLFTSKTEMLLPVAAFLAHQQFRFRDLAAFGDTFGVKESLGEYFITDALILNEDRHLGNIGVICDADTFEVKGLSPIYDNGVSLCCLYRQELEPMDMLAYARTRTPALYSDFIQGAISLASPEQISRLASLLPFRFSVDSRSGYLLEPDRVALLERIVENQIRKLLEANRRSRPGL